MHQNEVDRAYYAAHPEARVRSATKWERYVERHGDRRAYHEEYRRTHRVLTNLRSQTSKHGVTAEWMRNQLVGQAGRCGVCGLVMSPGRDTHVDHDHATGRVRGLLCARCNKVLGFAGDSARVLLAAAKYVST